MSDGWVMRLMDDGMIDDGWVDDDGWVLQSKKMLHSCSLSLSLLSPSSKQGLLFYFFFLN